MNDATAPDYLPRPDGQAIAYHHLPGLSPGVIFLGGFRSDMTGTKATALEECCRRFGRAFTRFDYLGHGQSTGDFADGTISRWTDDAISILDEATSGPQILVGSSMGGWIMLLAAMTRPERVAGLVGIAPAPDFTDWMWEDLAPEEQAAITRDGRLEQPSQYADEPYVFTEKLFRDGRRNRVLDRAVPFGGPVRILHGMADPDVPWRRSLELVDRLESDDVVVTFIKDGDHRLSRDEDLSRLISEVESLAQGLAE
ncbi:alpha/beta hydrolase [Oceanibacterium hippocampi]|nr:alpha/beta hydrolase [Oceanibacterium hippocampi]